MILSQRISLMLMGAMMGAASILTERGHHNVNVIDDSIAVDRHWFSARDCEAMLGEGRALGAAVRLADAIEAILKKE